MVPPRIPETNSNAQAFQAFFESWLLNLDHYLQNLTACSRSGQENEMRCKEIITQVMAHYKDYFEAKALVAREDVFLVLTPPWFSSFERAYLWIGGFRPRLAFRLVVNSVPDLTEDQSHRINALMEEVKEQEKELSDELTRLQEGMAFPSMVELTRHLGRTLQNGAVAAMESAFDRLQESLEALVQCADLLRRRTVVKTMEILNPLQGVRFLAATASLQLTLHRWGLQRDSQRRRPGFLDVN